MPYVNQRWLGGVLTNFQTISLRIKRLHDLERYQSEGQLELLPTQERMKALADLAKLQANLGGVKNMQRPPDAMFVVDLKTEDIAVKEAKRLRIPIIGLVDTNCDPDGIQYVIPGNDDAMKSCAVITTALGDVIRSGRAAWQHVEEERVRKEAEEAARKAAEEAAKREAEEDARVEAEAAEAAARPSASRTARPRPPRAARPRRRSSGRRRRRGPPAPRADGRGRPAAQARPPASARQAEGQGRRQEARTEARGRQGRGEAAAEPKPEPKAKPEPEAAAAEAARRGHPFRGDDEWLTSPPAWSRSSATRPARG